MDKITKQTETRNINQENQTSKRIIISIVVLIEAILAFRFIFKLLGANSENGFVRIIYGATGLLVGIFKDIFSQIEINTKSVFEPETVISMILVALIAWIVLKLIRPQAREQQVKTEYTKPDEEK
ncbi:MAG: YggT family protein [Bacillota bacterium]|nr:YggT family protein [Bacillota bacterium]